MADWDEIYRSKSIDDATPARVLTENSHLIPDRGMALDFASGLAGNGIYLAKHGLQVTAWDMSEVAIEKINQHALKHSLSINAEKKDLEVDVEKLQGQFDVITISYFLYRAAYEKIYSLLKPGGMLFYQTFSGEQIAGVGPARADFRLRRGELLQVYSHMNILYYREDPVVAGQNQLCSDQGIIRRKKMNQQSKQRAGQSALIYNTEFKWNYLKPGYWGVWLAMLFLWLLMFLPPLFQDKLADLLGDLARNINKKRRRIARKNIETCFPELTDIEKKLMLRNNYRHQAKSILSLGLFWWASERVLKKRITIQGQENIDASISNGRRVIFMAAHSYALEAAVSATTMRYPLSGPFNPMKNKLVDWVVAKGRQRHGTFIYPRSAGLRPIIKDVRAGCTMFYLPDEDLGRDRSMFVPFFGTDKATVPVLGRLAKSCMADVLPTVACYDVSRRQFVVHVFPPLNDYPQGNDQADAVSMNKALEKLVRVCPEQYFWIMKLFKTRPDKADKFYS